MAIRFACPVCGTPLTAEPEDQGSKDFCPDCEAALTVPLLSEHPAHQVKKELAKRTGASSEPRGWAKRLAVFVKATLRRSLVRNAYVWAPQFIASLMLVWALNPVNRYGYYILLRWVCCAVFAYLALLALAKEKQGWAWVLGITAVVYNPIMRVHLTRETWSIINVVTIGIAVASSFALMVKRAGEK